MIDDWTPAQEDMDWTKEHFDSMALGDTWSVSGALLEKVDKDELALRQYPPESSMAVERIAIVCNQIDIKFSSAQAELIEDPMAAAQKAAQEWTDPESDIPLVNFNLAEAEWSVSAVPSQDESGSAVLIDQWTVRVLHPNDDGDDHEVIMTPMDFHLIAGDDLFFTWKGLRVIERDEAIELADNGLTMTRLSEGDVILLGSNHTEDEEKFVVPPHLRGMLMSRLTNVIEEEE